MRAWCWAAWVTHRTPPASHPAPRNRAALQGWSPEPHEKQELLLSLQADCQTLSLRSRPTRGAGLPPNQSASVSGQKETAQSRPKAQEIQQPRASVCAKFITFWNLHLAAEEEVGGGRRGLTAPVVSTIEIPQSFIYTAWNCPPPHPAWNFWMSSKK